MKKHEVSSLLASAKSVVGVSGRFDAKSFRYKSKSIGHTSKVDSIQTEVNSIQNVKIAGSLKLL